MNGDLSFKYHSKKYILYISSLYLIFFFTTLISIHFDIFCFLPASIFKSLNIKVEIQKLRLYCDPHQSERETACEIYSVVRPSLFCNLHNTGHSLSCNNPYFFTCLLSYATQDDERVSTFLILYKLKFTLLLCKSDIFLIVEPHTVRSSPPKVVALSFVLYCRCQLVCVSSVSFGSCCHSG